MSSISPRPVNGQTGTGLSAALHPGDDTNRVAITGGSLHTGTAISELTRMAAALHGPRSLPRPGTAIGELTRMAAALRGISLHH